VKADVFHAAFLAFRQSQIKIFGESVALACRQKRGNMYSRREFGKAALVGLSASVLPLTELWAAPRIDSTVRGVKLGLITGSLNPIPTNPATDVVDTVIQDCVQLGAGNVEFVNTLLEPDLPGLNHRGGQVPDSITPEYTADREKLRQWRLGLHLERFEEVRKKFSDAGINLFSYVMTFSDDATDPEIDAVYKQMKALGVGMFCTNQTRVSMGERLVPFAEKYKIKPAWHTHAIVADPNEVATPESLQNLLDMSNYFVVNLDIGHFTAGNNDAVAYIKEHHDRITHIHVKDRKRDNGPNVEWGTGDTPIKQCLQLIRDNHYAIYCIVEREFKGTGPPVEETKKDLDYMRQALS
jgi:sugar phosphate isomerase/epimerase